MPRGGKREGAGRKSTWPSGCKFADTKLIRVPKYLSERLLEIAHRLDAGESIEFKTKSNAVNSARESISKVLVTQSEAEDPMVLSGRSLAKRLNTSPSVVSQRKNQVRGKDEPFEQWSLSRDPHGLSWVYDETLQKYVGTKVRVSDPPLLLDTLNQD